MSSSAPPGSQNVDMRQVAQQAAQNAASASSMGTAELAMQNALLQALADGRLRRLEDLEAELAAARAESDQLRADLARATFTPSEEKTDATDGSS